MVILLLENWAQHNFPKNNNWYDFYNDTKHNAGQTEKVNLTLENIPTFVRGGSFIPMSKIVQTTENYDQNELDIHFYYDTMTRESESKLYLDDGKTPDAFQKGEYEIISFQSELKDKLLNISIENLVGKKYDNKEKSFHFVIHSITKRPKLIELNGQKIEFTHDKTSQKIKFNLQYLAKKSEIKVKLK